VVNRAFAKNFAFSSLSILCLISCFASSTFAQGPVPDAPAPSFESSSFATTNSPIAPSQHKFWDRPNLALFTAAAALNMADFAVTRANLQSGGRELNPVVRIFGKSTGGLAMNFAGETVGVIGVSYFLHKTGHHSLERVASTIDIGGSAVAVAYGLTHR
jgi:hypothetical protein